MTSTHTKKNIAQLSIILLLLPSLFNVVKAVDTNTFIDLSPSRLEYSAVRYLQQNHIIQGTSANSFSPDQTVTRVEFLKITLLAAKADFSNTPLKPLPFKDIDQAAWYTPYLSYAFAQNIITGYADNTIHPDRTITKAEAEKILEGVFQIPRATSFSSLNGIKDIPKDSWYAATSASFIEKNLDPLAGNQKKPSTAMTRVEAAEMVFRVLVSRSYQFAPFTELQRQNFLAPIDTPQSHPINTQDQSFVPYVQILSPEEQKMIKTIARIRQSVVGIVAAESEDKLLESLSFLNAKETEKKPSLAAYNLPVQASGIISGSGFFVDETGLIITNKHVISGDNFFYRVITDNKEVLKVKNVYQDPLLDMAILEVEKSNGRIFPSVSFLPREHSISVGQDAITIGNVLGRYSNSVSRGIVSALHRTIEATGTDNTIERLYDLIQTDAGISQGNSGGPLFDSNGFVLGMNTALDEGGQNLGFAINVNYLRLALASFKTYGYLPRPYMGIRYISLSKNLAAKYNLTTTYGAYISKNDNGDTAVESGSPADTAGLRESDTILAVNGQNLQDGTTLLDLLSLYRLEDTISLTVLRGTQSIELKLKLLNKKSTK